MSKFLIIFISKTKGLLLETFFVYEFYSSSPITGFLLAGWQVGKNLLYAYDELIGFKKVILVAWLQFFSNGICNTYDICQVSF
jgi:hypothetical protein